MIKLLRKEKSLGVSRQKRRYDLPLSKSSGTGFLILLIALMTFLAMLALSASFALSAMTQRWSSGLENKATIEISAQRSDGKVLSAKEISNLTDKANQMLLSHKAVVSTHVMSQEEIKELVKPWLGENLLLGDVPLPGLISVELKDSNLRVIKNLEDNMKKITPKSKVDTHEEWLTDVVRFTGALQLTAFILTMVIGFTTITAIAGAVRSRMAIYHEEVELLHLMGARDTYISKQFQRHSLILGFQGAIFGVVFGSLALLLIGWVSGEMQVNLLPDFKMNYFQLFILGMLPIFIAGIATLTARQTVLKVLKQMP